MNSIIIEVYNSYALDLLAARTMFENKPYDVSTSIGFEETTVTSPSTSVQNWTEETWPERSYSGSDGERTSNQTKASHFFVALRFLRLLSANEMLANLANATSL